MKHALTAALLFLAPYYSFCQSSLSGYVKDNQGKPVISATVSLTHFPDSAVTGGAVTDVDGKFYIDQIKAGKYFVTASYIGLAKTRGKPFDVAAGALLRLAPLVMEPAAKALKGVTVTAQRPFIERFPDKTVVNVENSVVSSGSTALEVLQRTPGITLDKDDHILVKGKAGVTIMIDGKLTYLSADQIANLLKNMGSENIAKIEIITNPSAKYDASGNSGIINIITKKSKKPGFNGSLNAGAGYGIHWRYNGGINLNYHVGKINLFGNYSYSHRINHQTREITTVTQVQDTVSTNAIHNIGQNHNRNNDFKLGLDYAIDKKNTIGFVFSGYAGNWGTDFGGFTDVYVEKPPFPVFDAAIVEKNLLSTSSNYEGYAYNVNYKTILDTLGQELTFNADYNKNADNFKGQQVNRDSLRVGPSGIPTVIAPTGLISHQPNFVDIKTLKVDYTLPLNKKIKIESGLKLNLVKTDNPFVYDSIANLNTFRQATSLSNHFIYKENLFAAYISSTEQLGKTNLQLGLRIEETKASGYSATINAHTYRNYTDLFPNVSVSQKLSDSNQIALSITRRINRPDYDELNPFRFYLDQNSYYEGNAALRPEYAFVYELSYTLKQKYIATLGYTDTKNSIQEIVSHIDSTNKTKYTNANFAHQRNYSLTLTTPINFAPWWSSENNFSIYRNVFSLFVEPKFITLGKTTGNINLTENFSLPRGIKIEVNGFYNFPDLYGALNAARQYAIGAGLKKVFLKNKADVKISASDIFKTLAFQGNSNYGNIHLIIHNTWESRRIMLNLTYRFGNDGFKEKKQEGNDGQDNSGVKKGG